jgi:hypothetical protein
MGVGSQHHIPAALPQEGDPYPFYRGMCGPHIPSGWVRKISPLLGLDDDDDDDL